MRLGRLAAVAAVAFFAAARDGGDDAGLAVDLAHDGVEAIDDVEVVVLVDDDGVRFIEGRRGRFAAVAGVAFLAGAGDGGDDAGLQIDLADAVIGGLGDVEMASPSTSQWNGSLSLALGRARRRRCSRARRSPRRGR